MSQLFIPADVTAVSASVSARVAEAQRAFVGLTTVAGLKRADTLLGLAIAEARSLRFAIRGLVATAEREAREAARRPSLTDYNASVRMARGEDIETELAARKLEQV